MLIFLDIWTKNYFFKMIKSSVYLNINIFGNMGKKTTLSKLYVDIFEYMDTILFYQSDLKKTAFSQNVHIFVDMGKNRVLNVI